MQSFLLYSSLMPSDRDASEQWTAGKGQCLRNLPSGRSANPGMESWSTRLILPPQSFVYISICRNCSAGTLAMFFSDAVIEYMLLYNALWFSHVGWARAAWTTWTPGDQGKYSTDRLYRTIVMSHPKIRGKLRKKWILIINDSKVVSND